MKNLQEELEGMEKSQKKAAEDAKKELARVKKELENMCAANSQEAQAQAQNIKKEGAEVFGVLCKRKWHIVPKNFYNFLATWQHLALRIQ